MIYLVHGEDYAKTRFMVANQFAKSQTTSKVELELTQTTPIKLLEACTSPSLFGEPAFVIVDITQMPKGAEVIKQYVEVLGKIPENTQLILRAAKAVSDKNPFITKVGKVIENKIEPTSNIFRFIEAVFSKNRKAAYRELENLIKEDKDMFYIFAMLLYKMRVWAKAHDRDKSQVKEMFEYMHKLDKETKTGEISPELMISMAIEKVLNS